MTQERTQEDWDAARNRVPENDTRKAYLQLRWEKGRDKDALTSALPGDTPWLCHYELVLPLSRWDIRRETGKDGFPEKDELVIPIKSPTIRSSKHTPCVGSEGDGYPDTPFRDGAHARWDKDLLGGLDVFVISPQGKKIPVEYKDEVGKIK